MGPPSTHNSVNPFSKKRKFDDISQSNSSAVANSSAAVIADTAKSLNTTVYHEANDVSADIYHSANGGDDSRMEVDTSSAAIKP